MIWFFGGMLVLWILLFLSAGRSRKEILQKIPKKGHSLRILYPMSARILFILKKVMPERGGEKTRVLLQSMYVKENVDGELYLYQLKKTSLLLLVIGALCAAGLLAGIAGRQARVIRSLERGNFGSGTSHYELEISYRDDRALLPLDLKEVQLTESEIREMFAWSFDDFLEEVAGENPSLDHVTEPLNLVSEFRNIPVYWEIEDISAVNYNGEIRQELAPGEQKIVNLFATFSLEQVSETYLVPVCLAAADPDENEKLLGHIREDIEKNNSPYSKEVQLPEELDGYPLRFQEPAEQNAVFFLVMLFVFPVLIFLFYDRSLEKQVKQRQEEMLLDFTEIVTKLTLLYEAGLSIHGAFERIVKDQQRKKEKERKPMGFAYREMQLTLEMIQGGVSETKAYAQFGKRCGLYPYIKLGNLLEQNLSKGTRGMQQVLKQEVDASFEERKRMARKKGEEAGTKLLLPMVIMMLVVIMIVAIPALMSMQL